VTTVSFYQSIGCAISGGDLFCWGQNRVGAPGVAPSDPPEPVVEPAQVEPGRTWRTVSVGQENGCAIDDGGALWCWGENLTGVAGAPVGPGYVPPTRVGADSDWLDVSVGVGFACGRRDTAPASVWCWGANFFGQLGVGAGAPGGETPRRVEGDGYVQVEATTGHACAIREDRSLWCWGHNDLRQVSGAEEDVIATPAQVEPGRRWVDVTVGFSHSCAIDEGGSVACWGTNDFGVLGAGDAELTASRPRPVCR